jgi:hypothetical protein
MINVPHDYHSFGQVMVELMATAANLSNTEQEPLVQRYLQRFTVEGDDPDFDKRIMFEALTYGARAFRTAWMEQVPGGLSYEGYLFHRWLGVDLVLERR